MRILEKGQLLQVNLPVTIPLLFADPVRLDHVLRSIIRNAIMYTPQYGVIAIQASQEIGDVRVVVRDNGPGIMPLEQSRLFSPFFRADDPAVRDQQGWGLSLHLAYRLVAAMGGAVGVESYPGKGSTFWFKLPAAPPSGR